MAILSQGTLLGSYEVGALIGAGGMGEVYCAYDRKLQRSVALKVIARKPDPARLLEEARAASRLSHPHICTVYDVNEAGGHTFIVMELVDGAPLSEGIPATGLPYPTVVDVGSQIADALAHAHARGVIHRDLKTSNVMLTPDGRVKVLDFGLASRSPDDEELQAATKTHTGILQVGAVAGTLAYMAPEVLRGEPADERTDIWALGVTLYEMATGTRPFRGQTGVQLTASILQESVSAPAGVPAGLASVIQRCLAKSRGQRYQGAGEIAAALAALRSDTSTIPAPLARPRVRPSVVAALVGIIALLGVITWRFRTLPPPPAVQITPAGTTISARPAVAVLGFKNLSARADLAWLSTALSEMLTTELAAGGELRTVPGESVARARLDLHLPDAESFSKETLTRIRQNLATNTVVVGSYLAVADRLRLDVRLQDTDTGEILAAVNESGPQSELLDMVSRAGRTLRTSLRVQPLTGAERAGLRSAMPAVPEAARLYAEGLASLRALDAERARDLLERTVAAEPGYAPAHSALALAWTQLGYDSRAAEEARKALELADKLPREDRLWIEGRFRESLREWDQAAGIYATLFGSFPDNLEFGLRLAGAQVSANKSRDALTTVGALRNLPAPARDDGRIDLTESQAAQSLGEFKLAIDAARRAAAKAEAQDARILLARSRGAEGAALLKTGELEEAIAACSEARRIYATTGDRGGLARALNDLAAVFRAQGRLTEALTLFREAHAVAEEIGDGRASANAQHNIAVVLQDQGHRAEAKTAYEQVLAERRRLADPSGTAVALNNLANLLADQGQLGEARKLLDESLTIRRQLGARNGVAVNLTNLGTLLTDQGDLAAARTVFDEALSLTRELGNRSLTASVLAGLGRVRLLAGALQDANARHQEALAIREELGEKSTVAESHLWLARVALAEHRPADAQRLTQTAIEEFKSEESIAGEAEGNALLARILVDQSVPAASVAARRAAVLAAQAQLRLLEWSVAITNARVRAATGRPADMSDARRQLERIRVTAIGAGLPEHELEARLALAQLAAMTDAAAARPAFQAVRTAAAERGFQLIARDAAAAMRK